MKSCLVDFASSYFHTVYRIVELCMLAVVKGHHSMCWVIYTFVFLFNRYWVWQEKVLWFTVSSRSRPYSKWSKYATKLLVWRLCLSWYLHHVLSRASLYTVHPRHSGQSQSIGMFNLQTRLLIIFFRTDAF